MAVAGEDDPSLSAISGMIFKFGMSIVHIDRNGKSLNSVDP
jgi:hypothetical protein